MFSECANDDLQSIFRQTEHLLEQWVFVVSTAGFVYARPTGSVVDLDELRSFTRRLRIICDDHFPEVIAFDLSDVIASPSAWRGMRRVLRQFACTIDARLHIARTEGCSTGILILCRCGRGDGPIGL